MSSRAVRRLQRLKEASPVAAPTLAESGADSGSGSESEVEEPVAKKTNVFALLGGEDEQSEVESEEIEPIPTLEVTPVVLKPKKAKKKGKKNNKEPRTSTPDDVEDEEFERILQQAKLRDQNSAEPGVLSELVDSEDEEEEEETGPIENYGVGGKFFTVKKFKKSLHLLQFDPKNLNPDTEFENLFGKLSTAAIDDADATTSTFVQPDVLRQIEKLRKRVRGWCGRDRRTVPGTSRKLVTTKIRDDWVPVPAKPLDMAEIDTISLQEYFEGRSEDWKDVIRDEIAREHAAGVRYFQVVDGPMNTRAARTQFYISVVVRPDHEAVIRLLQTSPYQLETLLQAALIVQRQGDNSNTSGLIEKALFVFDWSLKNTFELGSGLCRLPFEYYLNRVMYLTLFRYVSVLTQKSTFYTALNYCKLLLSFEPADDPYGVRYFIDFYAIMAGEYQYLVDFVRSPLVQTYKEWLTPSLAYSLAVCLLKLGEKQQAQAALTDAFGLYPYTGHMLLEELAPGTTKGWRNGAASVAVELATAVYVVRGKLVFEEAEVRQFFVEELTNLIGFAPKLRDNSVLQRMKEAPTNLLRYSVLCGEERVMAKLPKEFWGRDVYEYDVLPPENGSVIFSVIDGDRVEDAVIGMSLADWQ